MSNKPERTEDLQLQTAESTEVSEKTRDQAGNILDILDDPNFLEKIMAGAGEDEQRHIAADRRDWSVIRECWSRQEEEEPTA